MQFIDVAFVPITNYGTKTLQTIKIYAVVFEALGPSISEDLQNL